MKITPTEQRVLDALPKLSKTVSPTYKELALHLGFRSTGSIRAALRSLRKKGFIHHDFGARRGVEVLPNIL